MSTEMITSGQDIQTLTTEIRTITRQTQQVILNAAIEIGRRLKAAKELVPYGEWGDYLENEVEFSKSTANNFMRLYEEYGSNQQSLFGGTDSQTLGSLPYTKALKLLAIPAEEREEFAHENDVEAMSTRELEKAIKERDAAKAEAENAIARAVLAETAAENAQIRADSAEALVSSLQDRAEEAAAEVDELKIKMEDAAASAEKARAELKSQKENPTVPAFMMERLRKEAEAATADKAAKELQTKLDAAQAKLKKAENERQAALEKLQALQKAAQLADPNAAVFKALFEQLQEDFNKLQGALLKVKANDPDLAGKLQNAVAALLNKLLEVI